MNGRTDLALRALVGLSVAVSLAVAAALVLFAHPLGDDYCNAVNVRQFGVLGAVHHEYLSWGGRWSAHILAVGFPALFDITRHYALGLASVLGLQAFSVWFLVSGALPLRKQPRQAWTLTLVLLALYWAGIPHPGQTVYFLEGAWVYSVNLSLGMVLIGCLARLPREGSSSRILIIAGLFLLSVLVAAAHELFALVLAGILIVGAAFAGWERDRRGLAWAACALGALIGLATVVLAPGNEVRAASLNAEGHDLGRVLSAALLMGVRILDFPVGRGEPMGSYAPLGWVTDARLLAATVLFVAAPQIRSLSPTWLARHPQLWKIIVPIVWIGALAASLLAGGWALGRTLPLRAFNGLYWVFLLGWFLTVFVYTRPTREPAEIDPGFRLLRTVSAVVLALGLLVSTNMKQGLRDLTKGTVQGFDRAMGRRYEAEARARAAGDRDLVVEAIEPWPTSYFQIDIEETAPELQRCLADYFELDSVHVGRSPTIPGAGVP